MWRSDLRGLRNLLRTGEGRKVLLSTSVLWLGVGVFTYVLTLRTLLRSPVLEALRGDEAGELLELLAALVIGAALLPGLVLAPALLRHELFSSSQVQVLLTAPVASCRLVLRAWLRASAFAALFVAPVALTPGIGLALHADAPWSFAIGLALGALLWFLPATAALLFLQMATTRFGPGQRLRAMLAWLQIGAGIALILAVIGGFVQGPGLASQLAASSNEMQTPALVGNAAALPMLLCGRAASGFWYAPLAAIALAALAAAMASILYRRAFEAWLIGDAERRSDIGASEVRIASCSWPTSPVASLLRKAWLESTRVRGNGVLLVVLGLIQVLAIAMSPSTVGMSNASSMFATAAAAQALLGSWQTMTMLLSTLLVLAVVGDDQRQMALLGTAPVDRGIFVRAKIVSLGWPFALLLVLAGVTGVTVGGYSLLAAIAALAVGLPILAATFGVMLVLGSWPGLFRGQRDEPLANNLRTIVPITAMAVLSGLFVAARLRAFTWFAGIDTGRGPFAAWSPELAAMFLLIAAWGGGGALLWGGARVARGNFERIYGAQEE